MGTSPAARLARIKVTYPTWSIRKIDGEGGDGPTFIAERKNSDGDGPKIIHASALGDLENKLGRAVR